MLLALSLLLAGCAPKDAPLSDGVWETVCGSYAWDESSQYTNSVLSLMWLDYGCVLFEFNLMEGSGEEDSATELVRYLTADATGLNTDLGAYTLNYPESLVSGWFDPIYATFDDSGEYLAQFIVAKDLSAVFRVDGETDSVLIYGRRS